MDNRFITVNMRKLFTEHGKEELSCILKEYSCPINQDVERFFKCNAVDFTKKNQSVTYLVFDNIDMMFVGYYSITIKPIEVNADQFSNSTKRKLNRVAELDDRTGKYVMAAYLIAQLGKNFTNKANVRITGDELLDLALATIRKMQYDCGGMVVFLEAEPNERLLKFYEEDNGFMQFDTRMTHDNSHRLLQLMRIL